MLYSLVLFFGSYSKMADVFSRIESGWDGIENGLRKNLENTLQYTPNPDIVILKGFTTPLLSTTYKNNFLKGLAPEGNTPTTQELLSQIRKPHLSWEKMSTALEGGGRVENVMLSTLNPQVVLTGSIIPIFSNNHVIGYHFLLKEENYKNPMEVHDHPSLVDVLRHLTQQKDLPVLLSETLDIIKRHIPEIGQASVYTFDGETLNQQSIKNYDGIEFDDRSAMMQWKDCPAIAQALQTLQPVLVNNLTHEPECLLNQGYSGSYICIPILSDGDVIGIINLYSPHFNDFSEDVLNRAEELSSIISIALSRAFNIDRLEQMVGARTSELERVLSRLEDAARVNDHLYSIIRHEIKSPLTSILSSAGILQLYGEKLKKEQIEEKLTRITQDVKRVVGILDGIAELLEAKLSRSEITLEEVDIKKLVEEIVSEVELWTPNAYGSVIRRVDGNIFIRSNQAAIRHILNNLLGNALKYRFENTNVTLRVYQDQSSLIFEIENQGQGIPAEDLNHIFEIYGRASNAIDSGIEGKGIGLFISKLWATALGGKIEVISKLNETTKFTVSIPLSYEP